MEHKITTSLQLREIFHLEFLRWFSRKVNQKYFALKGGSNLRFFFNSFRYSEDMDLDLRDIGVEKIKDVVMAILSASSFQDVLRPFGINGLIPPNINRAKQTQTTQRFKVHLISSSGEDLFTKIEFSRRGFMGEAVVEPVSNVILRSYRLPPLLIAHYDMKSAIAQKIGALGLRTVAQARDIFDLYILRSQYERAPATEEKIKAAKSTEAYERAFEINFEQFRDTVISYLPPEDQMTYNFPSRWDEIKLQVADFIKELNG
ncbi:MAG: nucleotidyl transferase AbiEii/AbiGii toxin family protein [Candidatus Omnitrophota bacterium]